MFLLFIPNQADTKDKFISCIYLFMLYRYSCDRRGPNNGKFSETSSMCEHTAVISSIDIGTFPNKRSKMSEPNDSSFFPATKLNFGPFQTTQMDPKSCIAAIPIRSIAPITERDKNSDFKTNPTKVKKEKKPSPKVLSPKQHQKKSSSKKSKKKGTPGANVERKNLNSFPDEANLDFSGVPPPICSCTGYARGCYKGGAGGWQSSCCNSSISEYPLPMSSMKPGARLAGRKMSKGAYRKVLCKLVSEGRDLSNAVDLKDHWAKHGTNKFVTIK